MQKINIAKNEIASFNFKRTYNKILFIDLTILNNNLGGGLRFIQNVLPGFVKIIKKDTDIALIGDKHLILNYLGKINGCKVIHVPFTSNHLIRILRSILTYFRISKLKNKNSVIWGPLNCLGYLKMKNFKCITTVHDVMVRRHPEFYGVLQKVFRRYQLKVAITNANRIISISNFTKYEILKFYPRECSRKKIVTIYEGLNLKSDLELNHTKKMPFVLFTGVGRKNKNLPFLVKSFDKLLEKYSWKGNLIIAGNIPSDLNKKLLSISKYPNRLNLIGHVSDKQLNELYSKCSSFIFPSIYEGFGLPPLEAFAKGANVVVTDIEVLKEVCSDFAIFFKSNSIDDCMEAIYKSINSKRMPFQNRKYILKNKFDNKVAIKSYVNIFNNIIKD